MYLKQIALLMFNICDGNILAGKWAVGRAVGSRVLDSWGCKALDFLKESGGLCYMKQASHN